MYECEACSETFCYQDEYEEHMNYYDHWPECEVCDRVFRTQAACNQHKDAAGHWPPQWNCETCPRTFTSEHASFQHMNSLDHWARTIPCEICNAMFRTQSAADSHMKTMGHYKNYCQSCDRRFQNENNLQMHLNSKIHRGQKLICPFCKASYTSASGLVHHLERASCPNAPRLTREAIYRMVKERDPNGLITYKQLQWRDQANATFSATDRAFNGNSWECYICHKTFRFRKGLNQHLNSAAHQQQVYHCPNAGCRKPFSILAGLFNHLESESCSFMRFDKVQKQVGDIIQGRQLISF